jgi:DNA polymerase III subunit beta
MKLTIARDALLKPLLMIVGVVERKNTMAILSNILLQAEGNRLSLSATDSEVELVAKTELDQSVEKIETTIPGRKLVDICRSLPDGVSITLNIEKSKVTVTSGKSRFVLSTLPADEFPSMDQATDGETITVSQEQLATLLRGTYFAMAQQDVRYFLNGLLLEIAEDSIKAVATDGHRLAMSHIEIKKHNLPARQLIVPRKAVLEIMRILEDGDDTVNIILAEKSVCFATRHFQFTSKLLDGRYPDYTRVIPQKGQNLLIADVDLLRQSLSRTAILSNEKYRGVRLALNKGALGLSANNPENEEAIDEIPIDYSGDIIDIGFNVNYLLDALGAVGTKNVEVSLQNASSSALIRGVGDNHSVYVVMPIRL